MVSYTYDGHTALNLQKQPIGERLKAKQGHHEKTKTGHTVHQQQRYLFQTELHKVKVTKCSTVKKINCYDKSINIKFLRVKLSSHSALNVNTYLNEICKLFFFTFKLVSTWFCLPACRRAAWLGEVTAEQKARVNPQCHCEVGVSQQTAGLPHLTLDANHWSHERHFNSRLQLVTHSHRPRALSLPVMVCVCE